MNAMLGFDGKFDAVVLEDGQRIRYDSDLGALNVHFDEGGDTELTASILERNSLYFANLSLIGNIGEVGKSSSEASVHAEQCCPSLCSEALLFTGMTFSS